ncbi:hypothetical protein [Burkholderia sp. 22313]|uniref:hypothetical protein n=1 Tax=Burkholderia sp. 22313 TaxID=3453908 RepID=UPI002CFBF180|nr:hypothetical protein [Burkholderia sp.]
MADALVALFYNLMEPATGEGPPHGLVRPARCANQHIPAFRPSRLFYFIDTEQIKSKDQVSAKF